MQPARLLNRCLRELVAGVLLVTVATVARGQTCGNRQSGPCNPGVLLSGGCNPPEQANQCFPDATGPACWTDPGGNQTKQTRNAVQSVRSSHPPIGVGSKPVCATSTSSAAPTVTLRVVGRRVFVDYDVPDYYCQDPGDWPPFFTCTNDPLASTDHLFLYDSGGLVARAFIYYEAGTWDTGVVLEDCGKHELTAQMTFFVEQPVPSIRAATDHKTVTIVNLCKSRLVCGAPTGGAGQGGGFGPGATVSKPINVGSGDVSLTVPLFTLAQTPLSLAFALSYHSESPVYPDLVSSPVGSGWTHSFAQTLRPVDASRAILYHLTLEGFEFEYTLQTDGSWTASSPGDLRGRVTEVGSQYHLTDLNGMVTAFETATGHWVSTTDRWGNAITGTYTGSNLTTVADSMGRQVSLVYTGSQVTQIILPDNQTWRLAYSGANLTKVFDPLHTGSSPPWRSLTYQEDSGGITRLLSEVRDDSGTLLEAHTYDSLDRGTSTVSEDGREQVIIEYATPAQGQTRVTSTVDGVTNQVAVFTLIYQKGRFLPTRIDGNCATCSGASSDTQSFTYTADNLVMSRTDGKGHTTTRLYNPDANVISKTEATGTGLARTTTYRYDYAAWSNFLTEIDEPSAAKPGAQKVTTMTWNTTGTPETALTTIEQGFLQPGDTAATSYVRTATFDGRHRLLSTDGPRSDVADVTTQAYYGDADGVVNRRSRLSQVTDPVGLVTTFDNYDAFGTARNVTDSNGVLTIITTDARGRVVTSTSKAVTGDPNEATDYVTTFTYDGRDRLTRTTSPRGNAMAYTYEDGTNRLVDTIRLDTTGKQQERRHVSLNTIGQVVQQQDQSCGTPSATCASWTTKRQESFGFDAHNRLAEIVHPSPPGGIVINKYDPDGLLSSVQDENHQSPNTGYAYDALDRLISVTQTLAGAPGGQVATSYGYDVMDNLTAVTDPNGNTTTYAYDDFRRMQAQVSPVTGTTTYVYDPAGNLTSSTDANGAATTRTYDAASRLLSGTSTRTGLPTETTTYTYDSATAGNYGKGRLGSMTDPAGTTAYAYERRGLLRNETRTIETNTYTSAYTYDANGNRNKITYPSGRSVNYTFDYADRALAATSGTTTYVTAATYLPFGPETSITFGNGTTKTTTYDTRYRPTENKLTKTGATIADYTYTEDLLGNITRIQDATDQTYNRDFTYDDLNRLTGASTGASLWGTGTYAYDKMGNMTSLSLGTSRTATFDYTNTLPKLASATENGILRSVAYDNAGNEASVGASTSTYSTRNFLAAADGLAYTYDARGLRTITSAGNQFGTITGSVVNAAGGAPIPNATVRVTETGSSTATDAAGSFTLVQIAGTYTLTVTKPGFLPATTGQVTLSAGGTVNAGTIQLSVAPGTISGTVISSAGLGPLPGATATVTGTANATTTDAAGDFVLTQAPGTYTVTITKTGFTTQTTSSFTLAAGGAVSVGTITLQANPASVTGRVTNAVGGSPVQGATVTANTIAATTDSSGNFSLSLVTGTYTLVITKTGFATTTIASFTVAPGGSFDTGTIPLSPLGTITGRVIQASGGAALVGATVVVTGTFNVTNTDSSGNFALSQPAGTYTLDVSAPGYASTTTSAFTLGAGGTTNLGNIELSLVAMAVYVGYADNLRSTPNFPIPWNGATNTVFIGTASPYDAGAIRLDNSTDVPIAVDSVTVNLKRPGPIYNLWGDFTIPSHGSVILTQTRFFNFDTSDYPIAPCNQPVSSVDPRVAQVTITIDGVATDYFDTGHVLDTGGFDKACAGNESAAWRLIGTTGISANGDFLLGPEIASVQTGTPYTALAAFTDTANQPVSGVTIHFQVVSGSNAGQPGTTGQAVTDSLGHASFTYTGSIVGADFVNATITNASGGTLTSNQVVVNWTGNPGLEVFVGYADNERTNSNFPVPWQGDPNVTSFIGSVASNGKWDAGAIRLDNTSDVPIAIDTVFVDLPNHPLTSCATNHYSNLSSDPPAARIWSGFTIAVAPHSTTILTQTNGAENFDTSDCWFTNCTRTTSPPVITLIVGGVTAKYVDTARILDTFGLDLASCPAGTNESLQWRPIGTSAQVAGQLTLLPATAVNPVGGLYTATAVLTDASGESQPNVVVHFIVTGGPKAGTTGVATTDGAGMASFTYSSNTAGTDTLHAFVNNASGGSLLSGNVTAVWAQTVVLALSPATAANALGAPYNVTVLATDGSNQALGNVNVTFTVTSGPNAGLTGQGVTNAAGQAVFSYTSTFPGTDALQASVVLQGGNVLVSNQVTATWNTSLNVALSPPSATSTLGASYTATATVTSGGQPVNGVPVNFQILAGPNANQISTINADASGHANFTYTSAITGVDTIQASASQNGLVATSGQITVTWISGATTITYTGPTSGEYNDPLTLTARLTETVTGTLLSGRTLSFTLGSQTASGTTDANGIATVTITPAGTPGPTALTVSFAGDPTHTSSSTTATLTITPDETALTYTGRTALAASSSDCAALGGAIVGNECRITSAVTKGGSYTINQTLHFLNGGIITVSAPRLSLSIGGNLLMDAGSRIDGNVTGCNTGRPITLLASGNITTNGQSGNIAAATIRSDSCSGGDIVLYAKGIIAIGGLIESVGTITGTGASQTPGGGPITIDAGSSLTIADTGKVSSSGLNPAADLVHLGAAGAVSIFGLVESQGHGEAIPNNPPNHCTFARPNKPANSVACVEVCAGDTLTIDSTQAHNGQVNTDLSLGGSAGRTWIDLFATGNITITGATAKPVPVHANNAPTNARGGDITIKSLGGSITTQGPAVQANASTYCGGMGGTVTLQAGGAGTPQGDVNLGAGSVQAKGATCGGAPAGGQISVRSFNGHVIGVAGGELNAAGGITPTGGVTLQGCNTVTPAVSYQGTVTPAPATILAASCGGAPVVPSCTVTGIPVGNQVSAKLIDPADQAPISNKLITFTLGTASATATTNASGVASTNLPLPGTQAAGATTVQAAFAGDTFEQASQTTAPVTVYQPTSFVVWGGNTAGLAIGQQVTFGGNAWSNQATSGDYHAGSDFLGFATPVHDAAVCEPNARTTGTTLLDFGCWTAKPGTATPPATLPTYIGVIVATSIGEVSGRVYGNIAAVVVVQVTTYGPSPTQTGTGTIRAVIEDGANLFQSTTAPVSELYQPSAPRAVLAGTIASLHFDGLTLLPRPSQAPSMGLSSPQAAVGVWEDNLTKLVIFGVERGRAAGGTRPARVSAVTLDPGSRRYSFYSPEMNLLAESELTAATAPTILYEYVWFNGHPVAQLDGGTAAHWTFGLTPDFLDT